MSVSEWKTVNLFNVTPCPDYQKMCHIKDGISTVCYNAKQKIFCDKAGWVHVFYRNWESISFQAVNTTIQQSTLIDEKNFLVILSREPDKNELFLQVFNLNKINKRHGAPCVGTARLCTASAATCLAACASDSHLYIAIGLQKGDVLLHRATLSRDMSANFHCYVITTSAIAAMALQHSNQLVHMYICSDAGISLYILSENNVILETKTVLDSSMAPTRCCALQPSSKQSYFVVGRDDALYCFTSDGRGPCYAFEGIKKQIAAYGNNLLVVVVVSKAGDQLVIIDTHKKVIVLSKQMESILSVLLDEGNECYVLTESGKLYAVREFNLHNKLRILADKKLFDVALRLVEGSDSDDCNAKAAAEIYLKYGDYFLLKGDLSDAVEKYVQTLGVIEPYTIIQKLMDSRHTKYLAQYLQALVDSGNATTEHIHLLQNCKERLHLPAQLEHMYPGQFDFDVSSDELDLKSELSLNRFLKVLPNLEQLQILCATLAEPKLYEFFLEHGQILLERQPTQTLVALKMLAGEWGILQKPERLLPFLIFNESCCRDFLQYVTEQSGASVLQQSNSLYNLLFELHLRAKATSEELLRFLETNHAHLDTDHAFILCRLYCFWPGLIYLFNNYMQQTDSAHQVKSVDTSSKGGAQLQKLNKKQASSQHLFGNLLNDLLDKEQEQSMLQLLHSLCSNKSLLVSHVKDYFSQEHFQQSARQLQQQQQTVKQLMQSKEELEQLLAQYSTQPIEFRSRICNICKQQLKLPAMYFLCQHSFHKECLSAYAERATCVACLSNRRMQNSVLPELVNLNLEAEFVNKGSVSYNDLLCCGIFEQAKSDLKVRSSAINSAIKIMPTPVPLSNLQLTEGTQYYTRIPAVHTKPKSKNPFEEESPQVSTNPFDEYDNNLNPFSE